MDLHLDFTGKVVIVTGAASGMGFCISKAFAESGAAVCMMDINEAALLEKASSIQGETFPLVCDVTNYEEDQAAAKKVYEKYGRIDHLINAAGGYARRMRNVPPMDMLDVPMEIFEWGLDLNLMGPLYMTFSALKYMKNQPGGCVINFGSVTGYEGDELGIDYPVAKSALMGGFTKSIALYGAPYGIRCCCVSPGPIMTRPGMADMTTLLKKPGQPEDVMRMVLYLCSEYGNFITGTNYFIDGGRVILQNKASGGNTEYDISQQKY